ncbi:unnamed protein product [Euphydryas editha]|uniref:Transposase Helix-turn-helix domain-containing protein n=1 Tax=Euphydryas editha TaxID=104508 RepID=A0AAU9UT46_EUPED|nr:unnamed protein product [Euphydryas editha]
MSLIQIIAICEAVEEDKNRKKKRFWVHPLNLKRPFFVKTFDELLSLISLSLYKKDTNCRRAVQPKERLMITLRYLATGKSFSTLSEDFLMGKSTISTIISETTAY